MRFFVPEVCSFLLFLGSAVLASEAGLFGVDATDRCSIGLGDRNDCGYLGINKEQCEQNGCCWSAVDDPGVPWCYHHSQSGQFCKGYRLLNPSKGHGMLSAVERNEFGKTSSKEFLAIPSPVGDGEQQKRQLFSSRLELKNECRIHGPDLQELSLNVEFETDTRLHVKITDDKHERFEIPESLLPRPVSSRVTSPESAAYKLMVQSDPFAFRVVRKYDNEVLFDTTPTNGDILPLVFEQQYMELSTKLPDDANIFGLGEVIHSFRRDPYQTRQTMWARDAPTPRDQNIYGTHPFYMEFRNGKAHGVFLRNSNGMDVVLRRGSLSYRVIGGALDLYFFTGPTPADVVHQYYQVIGHPHMISWWTLGFNHCKYGYKNLDEVKAVVEGYRQAQIPLETMWTDIDYMDRFKDFTLDPNNFPQDRVREFIKQLHANDQRYVLILDPAIKVEQGYLPYEEAREKGLLIEYHGQPFVGKVWPGDTVFPDFNNPSTQSWWTKWIKQFMRDVPVDGWWIDMNEPANFCHSPGGFCEDPGVGVLEQAEQSSDSSVEKTGQHRFTAGNRARVSTSQPKKIPGRARNLKSSQWSGARRSWSTRQQKQSTQSSMTDFDVNNPSYKINNGGWEGPLTFRTVPPDAVHYNNSLHYDLHNLYGHSEAIMTREALLDINPGVRPFVLSRSTFSGTGKHAGHWTGDNFAQWDHLALSIPSMLSFQLFGIPYVGADICGFLGDVDEELCARWMSLGAFYPFSRNHNAINQRPQEPYLWDSVTRASKNALRVRYQLLPHYYTLFYQAHQFGATVIRPFFFEFPLDSQVIPMDRQFMVGASILVTPVLEPGARQVGGYFPAGRWYDWYTLELVSDIDPRQRVSGQWIDLSAPIDHIPVHVRGGYIVPMQQFAMTTKKVKESPHSLIVALDRDQRAEGDLFMDDGESLSLHESEISYIHFSCSPDVNMREYNLTMSGIFNYAPKSEASLDEVVVVGLNRRPKQVFWNDEKLSPRYQWTFDETKMKLNIMKIGGDFKSGNRLRWTMDN